MKNDENRLRNAVGQLIVGGFSGETIHPSIVQLVSEGLIGGVILFTRNLPTVEHARSLVRALSALPAPVPLLISVDQEGGRVQRLRSPFPELPPMRAFGHLNREDQAWAAASMLGKSLRHVGFHQNYAPILDIDSNAENPVIGDRAFSSQAEVVTRLGAAWIGGLQSEGVAACGKHFPGHGDTNVDSHLALPRLDHDLTRLESVELLPFAGAIQAGVSSIMTAHILFTAMDDQHPATLSDRIIQPLLRTRLGFDGVVVSDDLEMKAITDNYGIGDAAVRAIAAGCDQILVCHRADRIEAAFDALLTFATTGDSQKSRILEAAARVERLKNKYVVRPAPMPGALPVKAYQAVLDSLSGQDLA